MPMKFRVCQKIVDCIRLHFLRVVVRARCACVEFKWICVASHPCTVRRFFVEQNSRLVVWLYWCCCLLNMSFLKLSRTILSHCLIDYFILYVNPFRLNRRDDVENFLFLCHHRRCRRQCRRRSCSCYYLSSHSTFYILLLIFFSLLNAEYTCVYVMATSPRLERIWYCFLSYNHTARSTVNDGEKMSGKKKILYENNNSNTQ